MTRKLLKGDMFWPLVCLAFLAMALLVVAVFSLVKEFDLSAKAREEAVVRNGLAGRIEEVAKQVLPQVVWDEAIIHLDHSLDQQWARENIGEYLYKSNGFSAAFILDDEDHPVFAAIRGKQHQLGVYRQFKIDADRLAAKVRAGEAASHGHILGEPIQASAISANDYGPFILTATLVQPDFGSALPDDKAPILISGMPLDQAFVAAFARRFMLDDLHVHNGDASAEPDEAHMPLRNDRGQAVATLDWKPQTPGFNLLRELVAPILAVVFALAAGALFLYRRARTAAQGLVASEARAAHLAYYDSLTGLPNRVLFFDRLGRALDQLRRHAPPVAVHCIDLDRFKEVNDTFGHHVGDQLIQEAAKRLAAQCRGTDTFARLGGDEFAIVQTDAGAAHASALAARLLEALSEPFDLEGMRVFTGCSIGVTVCTDPDTDPAEALRHADLALYRAKENGKSQYCFFEIEMDAAIKTRRALESDLREALARDALEMAYQPQVNRHGVMTGVEALVRWRHPLRGDVSPAFFVPIAEECGLIVELGMFTLRRAFEDSRRWTGLKIAINVSANQLRLADFVLRLGELVEEYGVDPRQFELEITEGILLGDDPSTHDTLRRLRQMGFSLALDDFGTGYSSLSYLQRYPISKIKIDRSFIANLGVDLESEAVVGAIVKLARALKLAVIAEGVETTDQRERLAAAGCSEIQGYLFSRPVTADQIEQLMSADSLSPAA
ncbi:putative bifunctional diguanylate cyclase/phosphodiesterase [Phenylobacterium conjunctum]|jgi:diguanylate cyclase (GGDEF)-like protein|uniref:Bifunctional diguanylate cyclase/phosphodiesterase n=1 Tax=Phenylobacterium conjunctum TaxID=1298959 RepID=A0ABW3SX91_9CAUL